MATVIAAIGAAMGRSLAAQADNQKAREFAEQIVQVQTKDDIVDSGALFAPRKDVAKPIAVICDPWMGSEFLFSDLRCDQQGPSKTRVYHYRGQHADA